MPLKKVIVSSINTLAYLNMMWMRIAFLLSGFNIERILNRTSKVPKKINDKMGSSLFSIFFQEGSSLYSSDQTFTTTPSHSPNHEFYFSTSAFLTPGLPSTLTLAKVNQRPVLLKQNNTNRILCSPGKSYLPISFHVDRYTNTSFFYRRKLFKTLYLSLFDVYICIYLFFSIDRVINI